MIAYFLVPFMAFLGGIVQGVTGFGCGVVMMTVFPLLFALPKAAAISTCCGLMVNILVSTKHRQYINFKKAAIPGVLFVTVIACAIFISTSLPQNIIKRAFGVFLLCLCCYYLFFNKSKAQGEKLPLAVSVLFIVFGAIFDGFFGIGGPLMALYFMSVTKDHNEYLGTMSTMFLSCGIFNVGIRFARGIVGVSDLPIILVGVLGIFIGGQIGTRLSNKLNPNLLTKLTYGMIGVAGVVNLLSV